MVGVDMARTRRKRHYSPRERAELREQAERKNQSTEHPEKPVASRPTRSGFRDPEQLTDRLAANRSEWYRERVHAIFEAALAHRPGLVDEPYLGGLLTLAPVPWRRDPAHWRPEGRGLAAGFRSLAAHLFASYPLSANLWDSLLLHDSSLKQKKHLVRFVVGLAQGRSVRHFMNTKVVPAPLTRRMRHIMTRPSRPMSLVEMVRRAQVLGYGGNEPMFRTLFRTELDRFKCDEPYWAEVVHWICRQGPMPFTELDTIVDYLDWRHRNGEPALVAKRSRRSLRRESARWYRDRYNWSRDRVKRDRRSEPGYGEGSGKPASGLEGLTDGPWVIAEIRTQRKLILEGTAMKHCVGTYGYALAAGSSSFWSLTRNGKRMLTIEVYLAKRTLCSASGKTNRVPRPEEMAFLLQWARLNDLEVADYIGVG